MSSSTSLSQKKTRRRTTRPLSDVSVSSKDPKKVKLSSYDKEFVYSEEREVDQRDPVKDQAIFSAASNDIKKLMKEIYDMKMKGVKDNTGEMTARRIQSSLNFVTLKKLNRIAHIRSKKSKDSTHESKQKVDSFHLQLQNLLYEAMHLQKEVTKCLEFTSMDEDIDLVDVSDFYEKAPGEISKPEKTNRDPHQLRLARLDWELEQRKRLAEKCKELETSKNIISKEIQTKRDYLDSLQPKLNDVLQATVPLQMLSMPFEAIRLQHKTARHLTRPLYILYVQANAYHEACDADLTVSIVGDIDTTLQDDGNSSAVEDDSDSDDEAITESKRRRRKTVDLLTEKRKRVLRKHPLAVVLKIKCEDGSVLSLCFSYLSVLQIVTVGVQLTPAMDSVITTFSAGDLLSPNSLLSCLFPGDYGNDTPNPANHFQLSKLGMDTFGAYITEVGHPYKWVQRICGLEFLENSKELRDPKAKSSVSSSHIETITKALRNNRHSIPVPSDCQSLFPAKLEGKFTGWKSLTYDDYMTLLYTQDTLEAELVNETDIMFLAVFERGSAKLNAAIAVHPNYPSTPPLFRVNISWRGVHHAVNDHSIRMMENEVNVHFDEFSEHGAYDYLLTNQLQRLMMCFDVYLEAESAFGTSAAPVEFAKEKVMPRLSRGPHRAKPFKYNPQHGFFSHR
uniref:THO complex subunit 5 homolog n=1 Tax=Saccoglossus kowalevskii TaxID=10224 RepID=A0ABM0MDK0_SACKO|nr:PREDICTED: THO complex subunit 5 homolog [Saccoglossus kowalevskii]